MNELAPKTFGELQTFADMIAESSFIPEGFKKRPGDIICAIQFAMELGLPIMQGLQNIAVINGKPSIYGDGALAVVRRHPNFIDIKERDPAEAVAKGAGECTIRIKNALGEIVSTTRTFTKADAEKAGLWGKPGPWTNYPGRMFQMRARSWAMRDALPEALRGMSIHEEAIDIEPIRTSARTIPETVAPQIANAAPAQVTVEHAPMSDDIALRIDDIKARMSEATTIESLNKIGAEVKALNVSADEKAKLAKVYTDAKARIGGGQ